MKDTPPRELFLPAELEEYVREHAPEFLTRAVESAAKPHFAVEYKALPAQKAPYCYDCEYCHRLRYLRGEWHCRITKPHEVPNPLTCFVRSQVLKQLKAAGYWVSRWRNTSPVYPWKNVFQVNKVVMVEVPDNMRRTGV